MSIPYKIDVCTLKLQLKVDSKFTSTIKAKKNGKFRKE